MKKTAFKKENKKGIFLKKEFSKQLKSEVRFLSFGFHSMHD